jgi:hypothetical protein
MTRKRLGLDQHGGVLALVAVTMVAMLGMAALAVDLARGFAARAEAQRVADSAALAGGSAYLDLLPAAAAPVAEARALEYALRNSVQGEPVEASQVQIVTIPDERKIRVRVEKTDLPTWFGRVLGFDFVPVAATAAAEVTEAGAAKCLKPFAVPDIWDETDDEFQDSVFFGQPEFPDHNNIWEEGEPWDFDPNEDTYNMYHPDSLSVYASRGEVATGYGSNFRSDYVEDFGRKINIKVSDPQSDFALAPGLFYPWRLPIDPNQPDCDRGGGGTSQGGAVYRRNICECNQSAIQIGEEYDLEPGDMIGPTAQGIDELIGEDPDAVWVDDCDPNDPTRWGYVDSPLHADYMDSPRVIKIALFDISQITGPGMQSIKFNNFALMFLENQRNPRDPIEGRFLFWAKGSDSGPTTGSLVLYLRLVE